MTFPYRLEVFDYNTVQNNTEMNSNYFFVLYISATVFSINTTVVKSYDANIKLGDRNNHNDGNINYIMKNVWLEPDYNSHNPPSNKYGKTNVDMDWFKVPKILSIDEKNNKITLQLDQYMEWEDSRVKVNYSAIPTMIHPYSYMKIPPDKMKELWHPNLDMFTNDILEWKSLHDPFWFQSAGIFKCPWTRNCDLTPQATLLYALKMWRVTLYCEFDFSTFPLDTQHCKFKQAFGSTSETVGLFVYPQQSLMFKNNRTKQAGNWTFAASGYTVMINPTGSLVESNTLDQNDTVDFGFDIRLQRIFQPYLFQYYIPCIAIVLVSMISFLIPLTAIPGRVTLVVTLFLTLTNIFTVELVMIKYRNYKTDRDKTLQVFINLFNFTHTFFNL